MFLVHFEPVSGCSKGEESLLGNHGTGQSVAFLHIDMKYD